MTAAVQGWQLVGLIVLAIAVVILSFVIANRRR